MTLQRGDWCMNIMHGATRTSGVIINTNALGGSERRLDSPVVVKSAEDVHDPGNLQSTG
jgi:hypothetical protein